MIDIGVYKVEAKQGDGEWYPVTYVMEPLESENVLGEFFVNVIRRRVSVVVESVQHIIKSSTTIYEGYDYLNKDRKRWIKVSPLDTTGWSFRRYLKLAEKMTKIGYQNRNITNDYNYYKTYNRILNPLGYKITPHAWYTIGQVYKSNVLSLDVWLPNHYPRRLIGYQSFPLCLSKRNLPYFKMDSNSFIARSGRFSTISSASSYRVCNGCTGASTSMSSGPVVAIVVNSAFWYLWGPESNGLFCRLSFASPLISRASKFARAQLSSGAC